MVGEPAELRQRPLDEELGRERRHCEVEALDPEARQAENEAHRGRHEAGKGEGGEQRHPRHPQHQVEGREGSDRHERRRPERELPGVSGQDVQAERGERENQERDQDRAKPVVVADERQHDKRRGQDEAHADPVLPDRKDALIRRVARFELPGLAVDHGVVDSRQSTVNSFQSRAPSCRLLTVDC